MTLNYLRHKKLSLKQHPFFNEAWLHERIADDPSLLGLGDVRVLDRERPLPGGGRLDMLLLDDENNRRYEVEIMLGATDPSHIIRTIEYWDLERRRYPGYDHVAVIIAEAITTRFLNVLSLLAGSISLIAIQLDAIEVNEHIVLNFVQVLDQTELRIDDSEEDSGGGQVDRDYWDKKAGKSLMTVCDRVLETINSNATSRQEFNFLRGYIGLRSNGVVRNFIVMHPRPTKNLLQIGFKNSPSEYWVEKLSEAGINARSKRKGRLSITVSDHDFDRHSEALQRLIASTAKEAEE